jgi:hypothetical protein
LVVSDLSLRSFNRRDKVEFNLKSQSSAELPRFLSESQPFSAGVLKVAELFLSSTDFLNFLLTFFALLPPFLEGRAKYLNSRIRQRIFSKFFRLRTRFRALSSGCGKYPGLKDRQWTIPHRPGFSMRRTPSKKIHLHNTTTSFKRSIASESKTFSANIR